MSLWLFQHADNARGREYPSVSEASHRGLKWFFNYRLHQVPFLVLSMLICRIETRIPVCQDFITQGDNTLVINIRESLKPQLFNPMQRFKFGVEDFLHLTPLLSGMYVPLRLRHQEKRETERAHWLLTAQPISDSVPSTNNLLGKMSHMVQANCKGCSAIEKPMVNW